MNTTHLDLELGAARMGGKERWKLDAVRVVARRGEESRGGFGNMAALNRHSSHRNFVSEL